MRSVPGYARPQARAAEPPANLEQALHQEIVGLNNYMAELFDRPMETGSLVEAEESLDVTVFEASEPEEVSEEFVNVVDEEPPVQERQPQQQAASFEEPPIFGIENPDESEPLEEAKPPHSIYWVVR